MRTSFYCPTITIWNYRLLALLSCQKAQPKTTVMAELGEKLLHLIAERDQVDTLDLAGELNIDHQKIVGAVKSLQSLGDVSVKDIRRPVQHKTLKNADEIFTCWQLKL